MLLKLRCVLTLMKGERVCIAFLSAIYRRRSKLLHFTFLHQSPFHNQLSQFRSLLDDNIWIRTFPSSNHVPIQGSQAYAENQDFCVVGDSLGCRVLYSCEGSRHSSKLRDLVASLLVASVASFVTSFRHNMCDAFGWTWMDSISEYLRHLGCHHHFSFCSFEQISKLYIDLCIPVGAYGWLDPKSEPANGNVPDVSRED